MPEHLIPGSDAAEFYTPERVYITERLNDPAVPEFSLAQARVERGVTTQLHRLDVDEWYLIRVGRGRMEVAGQPAFDVGPGDTVAIPRGAAQRITNDGDDDLIFDCLCRPRFTPASYEALE